MHSEETSPKKERLLTLTGLSGSALILLTIFGVSFLKSDDGDASMPPATKLQREETLASHVAKAKRDAGKVEWINPEEKIARIPIDSAVDLVLAKVEDSGNISFAGKAAPTVGTKLSTGPFTLVEIPPLAQDDARDAELLAWSKDAEKVEEGFYQYEAYCLQCHGGPDMPGEGPTVLFDNEWYYAATPSQMEQLLWKGIIEKGMPPWEGVLPAEVTGVMVAYLLANQAE
ncbi:MAG: c-type cytochrome [Opitutales bacterium]